jgi:vitamin B12 transporter
VRVSRNLNLNGSIFLKGARHAKLGDFVMNMKPVTDVNIGASYSYLNWFTLFGKVNNLLNSRYEEFYGYEVQGLNVMVGAAFSF